MDAGAVPLRLCDHSDGGRGQQQISLPQKILSCPVILLYIYCEATYIKVDRMIIACQSRFFSIVFTGVVLASVVILSAPRELSASQTGQTRGGCPNCSFNTNSGVTTDCPAVCGQMPGTKYTDLVGSVKPGIVKSFNIGDNGNPCANDLYSECSHHSNFIDKNCR